MTFEEKQILLSSVYIAIKDDSTIFKDILNVGNEALIKAIQNERERATDMEAIAVEFQAMTKGRYSENTMQWVDGLIKSKLEKWKHDNAFNWKEIMKKDL